MPFPTPFYARTAPLCTSHRWKDWAGYYAVCSFDMSHEREYFAFRHAAGLIDVSPLFKYEVYGRDAARFLSRIIAKNISKLKVGQVTYCCWCDGDGKIIDDGTVARLEEDYFRVTAALPSYHWFDKHCRGYKVAIEDSSTRFAALSLQGPSSRAILKAASEPSKIADLKFFKITKSKFDGFDSYISRTGYTGDLGYEIWVEEKHALKLWDQLMTAGRPFGMEPASLDAMDVTRIEAGFILNGVDYYSAPTCLIESRKSTPYEIGLGWTINFDGENFNGKEALLREKERGSAWAMVGLVLDWDEYEKLFWEYGLPPEVKSAAWRTAVPVYDQRMKQIGQATSGAWSPILKKNLALATVPPAYASPGTKLKMEVTVEYERRTVTAVVSETPFFNPERKRS